MKTLKEQGLVLIYDICSCPHNCGMDKIVHIATENNVVLWDSSENPGCVEPKVIRVKDESPDIKVLDTSTKEGEALLKQILKN
jgi:hypothetical protein